VTRAYDPLSFGPTCRSRIDGGLRIARQLSTAVHAVPEEEMMMMLRRVLLLAVLSLTVPVTAFAYGDGTPDEQPPAEEPPCDAAGLFGAAYGLCVAYCEANDCEIQPDKHACDILRANYARITGEGDFPCDGGGPGDPQ
jgi:hypothetical protein